MVYLRNNRLNKKKQKGDVSSKSIESFIIVVVMSCKDRLRFTRLWTLNLSIDRMYSIVALRIWALSLSFMFSLPRRSVWHREFSFWSINELSISRILFMRNCFSLKNKEHRRRKWFVDSISFPHIQISSRQSLKL